MGSQSRQKARKEYECEICKKKIKIGDEYIKFSASRFSPKKIRCIEHPPKQSELTSSDFLAQIYDLQDSLAELTTEDDLAAERDSFVEQLESLRDECQEKRDNMPEQLQETDVS